VKHKVHVPLVDRRKAQILANMGSEIQMMDLEDYNTFNVPLSDIPDKFLINPTALLVYQLVRIHVTMPLELMKV